MHKERGTRMFPAAWMCILLIANVSLQHGEASCPICSFWWAETLLPAGTAGSYWDLPEMCKNNCEQRTQTRENPNTLLALKCMLFIILFVAASLKDNQIHAAVEGGFS